MLIKRPYLFFFITALCLGGVFCSPAYAFQIDLSKTSAVTIINNLATQIPYLMRLVTGIAYIMGLVFIIIGVFRMKHLGEMRTMMSHEHSIKTPLIYLMIGTALLYFPTTIDVALSTFWSQPNPYGYKENKGQWDSFFQSVFLILQLVGTIAVIRGFLILTQLGSQGQHGGGAFGKGITHIVGGIFCINMYQFIKAIMELLGTPLSG